MLGVGPREFRDGKEGEGGVTWLGVGLGGVDDLPWEVSV